MARENKLREEPIPRKNDYLKYWRSIYYYTIHKHDITYSDLDVLIFLYSEPYFTIKKFAEMCKIVQVQRNRIRKMVEKGLIDVFRVGGPGKARLYQLSRKGSKIVSTLYKQMNGGLIQEQNCPIFRKKNATYMHKRHVHMILTRNEAIRQRQHQPHG